MLKPATVRQVGKLIPGREDLYNLEESMEQLPEIWSGSKTSTGVGTIPLGQGAGGVVYIPIVHAWDIPDEQGWNVNLCPEQDPFYISCHGMTSDSFLMGLSSIAERTEWPKVLKCSSGDDTMLFQRGPE